FGRCSLELVRSAISIRRRIASGQEGLSFCCLVTLVRSSRQRQCSPSSKNGPKSVPIRRKDTMKVDEAKSAELVARLETLPFSKWHRDFFILGFIGVMFDAADFSLFGAALPPIAREFGLGPAQSGLLATVGLVGAFVGALFWGTVSDYIGRRTSFSATIGIFSVFTALVAASWNVASLAVFRFMSNFGLGGEVPVTATLGAEFSPGRIRGAMAGNLLPAFPVWLILAAALS